MLCQFSVQMFKRKWCVWRNPKLWISVRGNLCESAFAYFKNPVSKSTIRFSVINSLVLTLFSLLLLSPFYYCHQLFLLKKTPNPTSETQKPCGLINLDTKFIICNDEDCAEMSFFMCKQDASKSQPYLCLAPRRSSYNLSFTLINSGLICFVQDFSPLFFKERLLDGKNEKGKSHIYSIFRKVKSLRICLHPFLCLHFWYWYQSPKTKQESKLSWSRRTPHQPPSALCNLPPLKVLTEITSSV